MKRYEKIDPDSWNDILKYVLALSLFFSFCGGGGGWFLLHCYNKKWIKILLVVTYDPKVVGNVYRVNESISVFCYNTKKHSKWTKENLNKNSVNGKVNLSLEYIGNHWLVQVWCVDYQRQTLAPNTAASQRSKMSERSIKIHYYLINVIPVVR